MAIESCLIELKLIFDEEKLADVYRVDVDWNRSEESDDEDPKQPLGIGI